MILESALFASHLLIGCFFKGFLFWVKKSFSVFLFVFFCFYFYYLFLPIWSKLELWILMEDCEAATNILILLFACLFFFCFIFYFQYWVSQGNKWCDFYKIFISNNPSSIRNHELGKQIAPMSKLKQWVLRTAFAYINMVKIYVYSYIIFYDGDSIYHGFFKCCKSCWYWFTFFLHIFKKQRVAIRRI